MAGAHAPIVMALCAHCVIEDDVFIGIQSLIRKGLVLSREPLGREAVTIGRGSVVGAGSVVTRNVLAGVVVAGNPAGVVVAGNPAVVVVAGNPAVVVKRLELSVDRNAMLAASP